LKLIPKIDGREGVGSLVGKNKIVFIIYRLGIMCFYPDVALAKRPQKTLVKTIGE